MKRRVIIWGLGITICIVGWACKSSSQFSNFHSSPADTLRVPFLPQPPLIDGDLSEWKEDAHHDGLWDIHRLSHTAWYEPGRNRITDHGNEPSLVEDLSARYYIAWDNDWLYFGAEVHDNVNDITPHKPEPRRWYYKDCVAWFIEAPGDEVNESFGQGDHGFCFVADPAKPSSGAWWRHGSADTTFLEEPLPKDAVEYEIHPNPWNQSPGDFILEAKVNMKATFAMGDPDWTPPKPGDIYRMMIVHTDPDGGDYGGHFLIYGKGDADSTWMPVKLIGEKSKIERRGG